MESISKMYTCTRLTKSSDINQFKSLMVLFGEVFEDPETYLVSVPEDQYVSSFLENGSNIVLVAKNAHEDVVGGIVAYILDKFEQKRREAFVYDVAVAKEYQGNGIGSALMREAIAVAEAEGCYQLFVQAERDDVGAVLFYESLHPNSREAANVGIQFGAWSIEWQGVDGNWPVGATSILEGIKNKVSPMTEVEYDLLGEFSSNEYVSSLGIAVVGEKPYAEGWGDVEYPILSGEDLLAIKNLQARCDHVVVILVSGRPLLITDEIASFDALVAAWLPGSEGGGVADVLFGDKPFVGTLPLPWPKYSEQLPINAAGITTDGSSVLFPRYFGLK